MPANYLILLLSISHVPDLKLFLKTRFFLILWQLWCFCSDAEWPTIKMWQKRSDKSEQFNCFGIFFIRPLILQKIFRYENDNQKNDKDEHWQSQTYTERNKDVKNKKKLHENNRILAYFWITWIYSFIQISTCVVTYIFITERKIIMKWVNLAWLKSELTCVLFSFSMQMK